MSTFAQEITVSDFKAQLMNEFGLDDDNDNEGTSSDAILVYMDDASRTFIQHRAWSNRLKLKTEYKLPSTTVQTGFTTASTSIVLTDTSQWPSTGTIYLDGDIIPYSANNTGTNTLTVLAADIDRNHDSGEKVWFLHPVPADFCKISDIWIGDFAHFPADPRNSKEPFPYQYWEIQLNEANGVISKYLMYYWNTSKEKLYMRYGSLAPNLTLTPDTTYLETPAPYRNFIKFSVFARIYRHLEDEQNALSAQAEADKILRAAAIFDSKKHQSNRVPLRTPWDDPRALLYRNASSTLNRN